mgnify:FL=1
MSLSEFPHLIICFMAAAALAFYAKRHRAELMRSSSRQTRCERIMLAGVVLIGAAAIYGSLLLGSTRFAYTDRGLDTLEQYVPIYVDLIERVRSGTVGAWNFGYGLGTAVLSYQSWVLDPFNLLLVAMGLALGTERLWFILAFIQVVKIAVSAAVFDNLLKRYCQTPLARILGAATFGFGGYLLLWGQHYWLGSMHVLFAFVVLCAERLLESISAPRFLAFSLCSAICMGWSPYCGFMVMLGCAFYCLMRIIAVADGVKDGARLIARLALAVACGFLISAVTLLPYATYLATETSRVDGGGTSIGARIVGFATSFVPMRWIPMLLSRFLGDGLVSCGAPIPDELIPATASFADTNCYEFANLGFGAVSLILIGQFLDWAARDNKGKARAVILVSGALCVLFCVNELLPALFNMLVLPKYRASFVLAVPVCIAMAVAFEKRFVARPVNYPNLIAASVLSLGVVIWSLANSVNARRLCALYALILCAVFACTVLDRVKRPFEAMPLALAALAIASTVADGFFITNNRAVCTEANFPSRHAARMADTEAALDFIASQDAGFYRVEKLYDDWTMYSDALVEGYAGINNYNSSIDSDLAEFYQLVWPDALDGGNTSLQRHCLSQSDDGLMSLLGVKYLLSEEPVDYPGFSRMTQVGDVTVYRNDNASSVLYATESTTSESELEAAGDPATRQAMLEHNIIVPDERHRGAEGTSASECTDLRLTGSSDLRGTLTCENSSIACLTVPYTSGWKVTVDGQPVELFRANIGFIGFEVPEGTHVIEARYEVPGLAAGLCVSAAGVVLLLLLCGAIAAKGKKTA